MKILNTYKNQSRYSAYIEWMVNEENFDYSLIDLNVRISYPCIRKIDANKVLKNETPTYVPPGYRLD